MHVFKAVMTMGRRGWKGGGHTVLPVRKTRKALRSPEKNMPSAPMKSITPRRALLIGGLGWSSPPSPSSPKGGAGKDGGGGSECLTNSGTSSTSVSTSELTGVPCDMLNPPPLKTYRG